MARAVDVFRQLRYQLAAREIVQVQGHNVGQIAADGAGQEVALDVGDGVEEGLAAALSLETRESWRLRPGSLSAYGRA